MSCKCAVARTLYCQCPARARRLHRAGHHWPSLLRASGAPPPGHLRESSGSGRGVLGGLSDGRLFSSRMPETPLSSPPPLCSGTLDSCRTNIFYSKLTCLRQSVARTEAPASPSLQCGKFCKPSRDCQTSQELQRRTRMHHVKYP
ncbi:hypothetical protein GWK47_051805 [Chionoecetes opilio]|uniref:Uncharacterized protein n=1 Tax=Chionoecetes opilio TaxID=41210 RepID=A0A8J5CQH9_CHIOP|nr:hypothetical protein GWK47_051805 [Chionoecetes opilio]